MCGASAPSGTLAANSSVTVSLTPVGPRAQSRPWKAVTVQPGGCATTSAPNHRLATKLVCCEGTELALPPSK